tara:strand:- start:104 stop:280 length:177 start_codon:yes stop_codon:yes gene_type:complete
MRVLEANYGDVRIFSDRPFGYKRFHVEWSDGTLETFSSLWYSKAKVFKLVEEKLNDTI